ncbi:transcriptional regulator [Plantactinospora sp. GCM10030261]|uniref:transcriptional regulator n=1 Tax=Plantactinospora sp. GCM10030261 TaxID=3273420 RepID=UPI0036069136
MSSAAELDPVIHAQARLRVVATLATLADGDRIAFPRLQEILGMTAGNLSVHLRKLEEARYVEVTKTHRGRTPTTLVRLSRRGALAFDEYTVAVRALLDAASPDPGTESPDPDAASPDPDAASHDSGAIDMHHLEKEQT